MIKKYRVLKGENGFYVEFIFLGFCTSYIAGFADCIKYFESMELAIAAAENSLEKKRNTKVVYES